MSFFISPRTKSLKYLNRNTFVSQILLLVRIILLSADLQFQNSLEIYTYYFENKKSDKHCPERHQSYQYRKSHNTLCADQNSQSNK